MDSLVRKDDACVVAMDHHGRNRGAVMCTVDDLGARCFWTPDRPVAEHLEDDKSNREKRLFPDDLWRHYLSRCSTGQEETNGLY